jgi:hypothetical protein
MLGPRVDSYNWVEENRQGREQFFLQNVALRLEHLKGFLTPGYDVTRQTPHCDEI